MKTFEQAMRKHLQEVEALEDKNYNLLFENSCLKRNEEELRKAVSSQAELIRKITKERDELRNTPDSVRTCEAIQKLETIRKQLLSEVAKKEAVENILSAAQAQNSHYEKELLKAEGMLKSEQARSRRLVWIMRKETEQHRRLLDILSATGCYGNAELETIKGIISSLEMQKSEELGD